MPYKDKEKQKEYQKNHYQKYKDQYFERSKKRRLELREKLFAYKSKLSCLYCGKQRTVCLDFHHNGDEEKIDTVSQILRNTGSWDQTVNEINKCDVVCANCHRKLHKNKNDPKYKQNSDTPSQQRKREITRWFYKYKTTLVCEQCDESESCCIDFHHKRDKEMVVGECAGHGWSKKRILNEIEKCEILCANCHREKHRKHRG